MKKALILNNEVVDVQEQVFPVSSPLEWMDAPNTVEVGWKVNNGSLQAPVIPTPTFEELVEKIRLALQEAIDTRARAYGFSGGNALMLYAGFTNPFQPLAQQFATWEASVWYEAEAYKSEVIAGNQPFLSATEAVAMMPPYPS
jgi:hypothetical protein